MMENKILLKIKKTLVAAFMLTASVSAYAQTPADGLGAATCPSNFILPTDLDYNNAFPITIGGIQVASGTSSNPPLMKVPTPCKCPGFIRSTIGGIGATFWVPHVLADVNRSGCIPSVGGVTIPVFSMSGSSVDKDAGDTGNKTHRHQVVGFNYPIFSLIDLFASAACLQAPIQTISVSDFSYIDPSANIDEIAALEQPLYALFANPLAQMACAADSIVAAAGSCFDGLFWCSGSWGNIGNVSNTTTTSTSNKIIAQATLMKSLVRNTGRLRFANTIGPFAQCNPYLFPIMTKCQYRFNQVGPWPQYGSAQYAGSPGLTLSPPIANAPTKEFNQTMLWLGRQCCLGF